MEWLVEFHGRDWLYRCVIIDESSGFKDHKSGRFKALAKVRQGKGFITRMHLFDGHAGSRNLRALVRADLPARPG